MRVFRTIALAGIGYSAFKAWQKRRASSNTRVRRGAA